MLAGSIAIVIVDMLMALGVDNGVMFWFANGPPDRQLGIRR